MAGFEEDYFIFLVPEPHRSSLPPTPNPAPNHVWETNVRRDLQTIASTKIGSALLSSIRWHGMAIMIQPLSAGDCGAGAFPTDYWLPKGGGSTIAENIGIWYSPDVHGPTHQCEARYRTFGQIPIEGHQVLLHELVHAFRLASSKFNKRSAGKGFAFHNTSEEIYAVLIQGIYASERGTKIRASHTRHFEIDKELEGSFEYFKTGTDSYKYIKEFCSDHPGLSKMISRVYTHFNPIRAFYYDHAKALRMSQSKTAKERDVLQQIKYDAYKYLQKKFPARP